MKECITVVTVRCVLPAATIASAPPQFCKLREGGAPRAQILPTAGSSPRPRFLPRGAPSGAPGVPVSMAAAAYTTRLPSSEHPGSRVGSKSHSALLAAPAAALGCALARLFTNERKRARRMTPQRTAKHEPGVQFSLRASQVNRKSVSPDIPHNKIRKGIRV